MSTWRSVRRQTDAEDIAFADLKPGDVFHLFEPDGTLVGVFRAMSQPKPCEPTGNFEIQVDAVCTNNNSSDDRST